MGRPRVPAHLVPLAPLPLLHLQTHLHSSEQDSTTDNDPEHNNVNALRSLNLFKALSKVDKGTE